MVVILFDYVLVNRYDLCSGICWDVFRFVVYIGGCRYSCEVNMKYGL